MDILEMPNWDQAGGEPAVTNKNFSVADTMHAVAEFYNDETPVSQGVPRGCGIDLHWVVRPIDLGPMLIQGTDHGGFLDRPAYHATGEIYLGSPYFQRTVQGSGYVHSDLVMKNQGDAGSDDFNMYYNKAGHDGQLGDHNKRMRKTELEHFVRLMLVSRWLVIQNSSPAVLQAPDQGPAIAVFHEHLDWETHGALIAVSGIREEGVRRDFTGNNHYTEAEFNVILQYAITHELGHLIIREQEGGGWSSNHYFQPGAVMGAHPGLGGINDVHFHNAESSKINLPGRASVPPPVP